MLTDAALLVDSEHDPKPCAWIMRADDCDGSADWVEVGTERPAPEQGFMAHPLYDRATLDDVIVKERERIAREGLALVRGRVFE